METNVLISTVLLLNVGMFFILLRILKNSEKVYMKKRIYRTKNKCIDTISENNTIKPDKTPTEQIQEQEEEETSDLEKDLTGAERRLWAIDQGAYFIQHGKTRKLTPNLLAQIRRRAVNAEVVK